MSISDVYNGKIPKSWEPADYRIEVAGKIGPQWSEYFSGMEIINRPRKDKSEITILTGRFKDQAELSGTLNILYDLHLAILSIRLI